MTAINAKYFRSALADADKSQRDMARALGVDPSAIVMLLKGKRRIQLDEAQKISRLTMCSSWSTMPAGGTDGLGSRAKRTRSTLSGGSMITRSSCTRVRPPVVDVMDWIIEQLRMGGFPRPLEATQFTILKRRRR